MKFSITTGCFYPDDIEYAKGSLPADAIEVPYEDFAAAMARQPGETLSLVNGRMVILPAASPTAEELHARELLLFRSMRDDRLQLAALRIAPLQDAVEFETATAEEQAALAAWKRYRVTLNRLTLTNDQNAADAAWPQEPAN